MVALAVLRHTARASPARLVAGTRVSLASSASSCFTRSMVSKTSSHVMNAGTRAFHGSARRCGSGSTDVALAEKLKEELKYEKENSSKTTPKFVTTFLENGVWSLKDVRGHDEVTMSRKFGDENIQILFSTADLQTDTDFEGEEQDPEADPEMEETSSIRAALSISKSSGPGGLNVDLVCQEGQFIIENLSFFDDAKLGTDLSAEADWKRRGLYLGPQFDSLDVGVQEEFEKYLRERGVNEKVAVFIPEYASYKEQQEYVKWLTKVQSFVSK